MFFADDSEPTEGPRLHTSISGSKRFESALDVSVAERYRNAPDEDSDDGVSTAIVVPSRGADSSIHLAGRTAPLDSKSRETGSVGEELLRGMVRAAKKEGREDAAKAMRAANQEALPKFVGGFAGAGGTAHASFEPRPGMVVVLCLTNANNSRGDLSFSSSSNETATDGPRVPPRHLVWRKESEISSEEAAFGHPVTDATVASIFSVVRVTPKECEVELADGERKVVLRNTIRPATKPEQDLYDMWTRDPRTLPPESARRKRSRNEGSGTDLGRSAAANPNSLRREMPWVLKHLVVRCVSSSQYRDEYLGKKLVVQSVGTAAPSGGGGGGGNPDKSKSSISVMAMPLSDDGTLCRTAGLVQFLQRDLETVLPKQGEQGVILAGPRCGSVAVLRSRVRDKQTGDVTDVTVAIPPEETNAAAIIPGGIATAQPAQDDEIVTLSPSDFCAFFQQRGAE